MDALSLYIDNIQHRNFNSKLMGTIKYANGWLHLQVL